MAKKKIRLEPNHNEMQLINDLFQKYGAMLSVQGDKKFEGKDAEIMEILQDQIIDLLGRHAQFDEVKVGVKKSTEAELRQKIDDLQKALVAMQHQIMTKK